VNSRERMLTAIRHEIPDRIPMDALHIENAAAMADFLSCENDEDAIREILELDGKVIAAEYLGDKQEPVNGIEFNEWGTLLSGDYSANHPRPLAKAGSITDIENYNWPDPAQYDYTTAIQTARQIGAKSALRGPYWQPVFCRTCDMFGMEEGMIKMMTEPDIYQAAIEQIANVVEQNCIQLLDACRDDLPILALGDDFATQRGLMIPPEKWRKFFKPRYARLFEIGKSRGKYIWFHSCGNITEELGDLIDIGLDVWETVQLHTLGIPAEKLKQEYGKDLTFFGAVNTQRLPNWTRREVAQEVEKCIKILGENGGYICGPDHGIRPEVPAENTVALFETARNFRGIGYTQ